MKAKHSIRIAMPIEGVQYSQIEYMQEWEIEGESFEEIIKKLEVQIEEFVNEKLSDIGGRYKNKIQDLNDRLERARQAYLDVVKNNQATTNK